VKPPPFGYVRPASIAEAIAVLAADEDARALAGGQSLVPMLNFRLAAPTVLVDLSAIPGLDEIRLDADGVRFGAMVRQATALADARVAEVCPIVTAALAHVGHPQIRSRGTVGGIVAHADPAAELLAALLAVDASVETDGPGGARRIDVDELLLGHFTTALEPGELIVGIRVPAAPDSGAACVEISRRRRDFALVGAVAQVRVDRDGVITDARAALFAAAERAVRLPAVEDALRGREPDPRVVAEAVGPERLPAASQRDGYAAQVAPVMVRRALEEAVRNVGDAARGSTRGVG
jgi:aerobic carbon-monoxide dehydrogenase medium subunit